MKYNRFVLTLLPPFILHGQKESPQPQNQAVKAFFSIGDTAAHMPHALSIQQSIIQFLAEKFITSLAPKNTDVHLTFQQTQMLMLCPFAWKKVIEDHVLNGVQTECLTPAEAEQFFTKIELYPFDGYRILLSTLPGFKAFIANNVKFFKKHGKTKLLYSKNNIRLIRRYYQGTKTPSEQDIALTRDMLTPQDTKLLVGTYVPETLWDYFRDEKRYHEWCKDSYLGDYRSTILMQ